MLERKLKNISIKDLEEEIADLLTKKLGESDFKVEINNLKFGFKYDYITEMNLVIKEKAFELSDKSSDDINVDEIAF